jgi:sugar lactone lactonase YvrE
MASVAHAERVATGFEFTEGPLYHPDGYLYVSDVDARVHYWLDLSSGKKTVLRRESGGANGAIFDLNGYVVMCEQDTRKIVRFGADGSTKLLAEEFDGKRLNRSNDLALHSTGAIYFTDPQGLMPEAEREQGHSSIFRLHKNGRLDLLATDMNHPNGIAFSPDESVLYVSNSRPDPHLHAYDVNRDGLLANSRVLAEMPYVPADGMFEKYPGEFRPAREQGGVPDGLKVDEEGTIFCTGPRGVLAFNPYGEQTDLIELPELPANLTFGGPDRQTMYITARTSVYSLPVGTPGVKVPGTPRRG